MRLVFVGTPATALPSLDALLAAGHDVVAVLTRPDAPAGRGRRRSASAVAQRARQAGLEVLTPSSPREPAFLARLRELEPQVCAVVAYGALIPAAALAVPPLGWVNLHFSLLPAWRGAAPVQHALLAGDDITGATTFVLEESLDTGPLLGTMTEAVLPRDTAGDLLARLASAGAQLLAASLDALASGAAAPTPQPAEGVSYAPKLTTADAAARWGDPALAVDRRLRACAPAPGAWTTFRGQRLKIGPVLPEPTPTRLAPGELLADQGGVLVGVADGAVRLSAVQPAGRRPSPAADWARGARLAPGERFGA